MRKSLVNQSYHDIPAARSYDGNDWEPVFPILEKVNCNSNGCSVTLFQNNGFYILVPITAPTRTDAKLVSDFLIHSTFGPSQASISSFPSGSTFRDRVKAFIDPEIRLPASLHRAYYRASRNIAPIFGVDSQQGRATRPCDVGSRWE
jgi:hypothetical protein